MPSRTRVDFEAQHLADDQLRSIGRELRLARLMGNRTQAQVAALIGASAAQVCRIERGNVPSVGFRQLVRFGSAVGLRVWMKAYPGGRRLLDEPQIGLLRRLRDRCPAWKLRTEETMPIEGDLRAADAVLRREGCTVVVEAITRLVDFQAQSRAALAKKRDLRANRLVLLIANTRTNRRGVKEAMTIAADAFPLGTVEVLRALEAGEDPGADGIVLL